MESVYKISACRGAKTPQNACFGVSSLRLALPVLCLLAILAQTSARPSDATKAAVTPAPADEHSRQAHALRHNLSRRSIAAEQDETDYYDEDYKRVKRCYEDEDVNELCQRCSKVTKSAIVFPMCCSNEDQTMDWCEAYVYYGIQN
ncbi:uncharacterized protein LOC129778004 [Toxorhynchites rutilus septentrionalis]|uniref:uncharacterized protein LOC129778004 n=1 Tax=Toxorhynchites rutilus septentrionalis TaxID=329112 RepID=UPI00247B27A2|nr:uncharacterized protein LOC129778004 [Toxorhynchites rutilus septentrionalis]